MISLLADRVKELAPKLFDIGAVKFGLFKLKLHEKHPDAPLSPIYIDLRILRSFPDVMDLTVGVYKELIKGLRFDLLADIPTAATPIVAILSHQTRIPVISPKKQEKGRGIIREIDGVFQKGQTALLIDDLITQADSKFEMIKVLEENDVVVGGVVVLLDREQGGTEQLEKAGYKCKSALKLTQLLELYLHSGKITEFQYNQTIAYLKSASSNL